MGNFPSHHLGYLNNFAPKGAGQMLYIYGGSS